MISFLIHPNLTRNSQSWSRTDPSAAAVPVLSLQNLESLVVCLPARPPKQDIIMLIAHRIIDPDNTLSTLIFLLRLMETSSWPIIGYRWLMSGVPFYPYRGFKERKGHISTDTHHLICHHNRSEKWSSILYPQTKQTDHARSELSFYIYTHKPHLPLNYLLHHWAQGQLSTQ